MPEVPMDTVLLIMTGVAIATKLHHLLLLYHQVQVVLHCPSLGAADLEWVFEMLLVIFADTNHGRYSTLLGFDILVCSLNMTYRTFIFKSLDDSARARFQYHQHKSIF